MPNNIYVQGSYIDIHDNENVFLSVDKGEVKVSGTNADPASTEVPIEVPDVLQSAKAVELLEGLTRASILTPQWQPIGLSLARKGLLASFLAERLDIKNLWQFFASLWGTKPDTLRVAWNKALDQSKTAEFLERLKNATA